MAGPEKCVWVSADLTPHQVNEGIRPWSSYHFHSDLYTGSHIMVRTGQGQTMNVG